MNARTRERTNSSFNIYTPVPRARGRELIETAVPAFQLFVLISPRKKLAVSLFFDFIENDSSLHDFLSRGVPHQQAANEESTLLKGEKLNKQSP